ncbi:MAG: hypothetical protein H7124_16535 [Phycisphaerales bacterium]|nr:hypothetical protein [Hyphomonadaceae bacterium]
MLQQDLSPAAANASDPEIARHEVSEDGVNWRPYDPQRDRNQLLHKRIEFAPLQGDGRGN